MSMGIVKKLYKSTKLSVKEVVILWEFKSRKATRRKWGWVSFKWVKTNLSIILASRGLEGNLSCLGDTGETSAT